MVPSPTKTSLVIVVKTRAAKSGLRYCKGCGVLLKIGDLCARYKRRRRVSYHCQDCCKRYNPGVWEEYEESLID